MKHSLLALLFVISGAALAAPIPVGTNNNGSIIDSMVNPETGAGFIHMYREHEHFYGTLQMINMLQKTAAEMNRKFPNRDRMQIEDISAEHGGDIEGHASHENGLDADVQYYKTNSIEHDPIATGQKFADKMVIKNKVSPNFDVKRNWELMKTLHKFGDVQKIFIDVVLKNEFCKYSKKTGEYLNNIEVLRSLRHNDNHQDHLHVRVRCPKDAKKCTNQAEAPEGSGCP